jgi:glycosyltransferase involved in cell wall biosynthesis
MGTDYILAENTYRLGLYHITAGPWCEAFLRNQFGAPADHYPYPIDADVYQMHPRIKPGKNIVFFAKPEMPRRCYELGVKALEVFHRLQPHVEIILFGSRQMPSTPFRRSVRGVMPTIHDLANLYSNADLGLAFSLTNPSLVPYEMMACGLPVVDLDRPGNEINYQGRRDIAFLADPQPAVMAQQIANLLASPSELKERSQKGLEFVRTFPSEEQMVRRVEELMLQKLATQA